MTLVTFVGLASLKGQVLGDIFKFKDSEMIEMTTQVTLGKKGVPSNRELQYTP